MKVHDVMKSPVVSVRSDTTVEEIAQLLVEHHIHSVPVIDEENHVIGIVSESDLFLKEKGIPFSAVKLPALFEQWVDPVHLTEIYQQVRHHTAKDIMSHEVVCADVNDHTGHVAWLMTQHGLRGMPVTNDGKLVGFVSRIDLIQLLAKAE